MIFCIPSCVIRAKSSAGGPDASRFGQAHVSHDRSIDVHVSNLRRKLGPYDGEQERIKAIRGSGYVYLLPGEQQ